MIVKTGANYQAEGGYIEASIENGIVTVNNDVETIGVYYAGYENLSVVPVQIKVGANITSLTFYGLEQYENGEFLFDNRTVLSGVTRTFYMGENCGMRVGGENLKIDYAGAVIKTVSGVQCLFLNKMPEPGTVITVYREEA